DRAQADTPAGKLCDDIFGADSALEDGVDEVLLAPVGEVRFHRFFGNGIPVYSTAVILDRNDKFGIFNESFYMDGSEACLPPLRTFLGGFDPMIDRISKNVRKARPKGGPLRTVEADIIGLDAHFNVPLAHALGEAFRLLFNEFQTSLARFEFPGSNEPRDFVGVFPVQECADNGLIVRVVDLDMVLDPVAEHAVEPFANPVPLVL